MSALHTALRLPAVTEATEAEAEAEADAGGAAQGRGGVRQFWMLVCGDEHAGQVRGRGLRRPLCSDF